MLVISLVNNDFQAIIACLASQYEALLLVEALFTIAGDFSK